MRISEIRNPQDFQDLCQQLLVAEYGDFQIVDDSSGDRGIDGYVPSTRTLYAMYCPEKPPPPKRYYQRKINDDLRKAAKVKDELGYPAEHWIFLTPAPLGEELHRYISEKAKAAGFATGENQSETHLIHLLAKHAHLRSQFLPLIVSDLESALREVKEGVADIGSKLSSQGSDIRGKLSQLLAGSERKPTKTPQQLPVRLDTLHPAEFFRGREKQLKALDKFCRQGNKGVLALVGLGGAGKTAIVRHFLEQKGWLGDEDSLDRPDGLFIWSFYKSPSAADFFNEAFIYFSKFFERSQVIDLKLHGQRANPYLLVDVLQSTNRRCVLVMDGLEKMQLERDSPDYSRGRLIDAPIRTLLGQIADGCGWTKAIATSRISLADLAGRPSTQYQELKVDALELEAARSLLQRLGVVGPERFIDKLARNYGRHALTLDVLGRLLTEYYDGKPAKASALPRLETARGTTILETQAKKLGRVLTAYEALLNSLELAALQCLSIFRRPIDFDSLKEVFFVFQQQNGMAESNLSPDQFRTILHRLADLRLVILEKNAERQAQFTSHPAIRDHFYQLTPDRELLHKAYSIRLKSTLTDIPGKPPREPKMLDEIVELIYHTYKAGLTDQAYRIYEDRLGGYLNLGWGLGDHLRGAEVMQLFAPEANQVITEQVINIRLLIDAGLYWKNIGQLDEAICQFEKAARAAGTPPVDIGNLALALQNLSSMQVLRGLVPEAEQSARTALEHADAVQDERLTEGCRVRLATALALQGQTSEAEEIFRAGKALITKERKRAFPRDWPGIRLGWLLLRQGRYSEANDVLQKTRELSQHFNFRIITARADVLLAELACRTNRKADAKEALARVFAWASVGYDEEMLIAAYLVSAWLALINNDAPSANRYIRTGLREAQEYGYSIYWIELKLAEGRAALSLPTAKKAEDCVKLALGGQPQRNGRPELFGARASGYLWGQADALELLADLCELRGEKERAREFQQAVVKMRIHLHGGKD
ncbi:MAG: hypothetical protein ACJ74W_14745 [Pyrinomonadaceae bacterium]